MLYKLKAYLKQYHSGNNIGRYGLYIGFMLDARILHDHATYRGITSCRPRIA